MNEIKQSHLDINDEQTVTKICEEYIHLPKRRAQIYVKKNPSLDESELTSSGNVGLFIGAKKLDRTRGIKPETYLIWWIDSEIRKSMYENRNVHIPSNKINEQYRLNKENKDETRVVHQELYLQSIQDNPESNFVLDALRSYQKNNDIRDFIFNAMKNANLSDIEKQSLIMKFGFDDEEEKTYEEIAEKLNITAMGVWKAVDRAKDKLKKHLEELLE